MRSFKFKAFDKRNKRMYFSELGDLLWYTDKTKAYAMPFAQQPYGEDFSNIMQYTGLKDKTGTEIYEGDILSYQDSARYTVAFSHGCFVVYGHDPKYSIEYRLIQCIKFCKVIGNLYENKDLIPTERKKHNET